MQLVVEEDASRSHEFWRFAVGHRVTLGDQKVERSVLDVRGLTEIDAWRRLRDYAADMVDNLRAPEEGT